MGTDAGREALERNLADHVPQAEAAVTGQLVPELDLVAADVVVADAAPEGGNGQAGPVDHNGEEVV